MTALRDRILARQAVVVERLRIAEAAVGHEWSITLQDSRNDVLLALAYYGSVSPSTAVAECRRELAGIDADLALLDELEVPEGGDSYEGAGWVALVTENLTARYPEGEGA